MSKRLFGITTIQDEGHWISVSDLMSGLMFLFLFVAVIYIKSSLDNQQQLEKTIGEIKIEKNKIKEIAVSYQQIHVALGNQLERTFRDDFQRWHAEIDKATLSIRFNEIDTCFDVGKAELKPRFQDILTEFFPKYLTVLAGFWKDIEEVRIEGHTSSEWLTNVSEEDAYFLNMGLSQNRTKNVLEFCLNLSEVQKYRAWARSIITANGLSSSKLIVVNGIEDKERSRRVEFRVRTNAEAHIVKILQLDGTLTTK